MSQPVKHELSKAQLVIAGKTKGNHLELIFGEDTALFFHKGQIYAAWSGGALWHYHEQTAAFTKMVNSIEPLDAPRIRSNKADFDFTVGQILTMAGLPLTRLPK